METPGYSPSPAEATILRPGVRGAVIAADAELLPADAATTLDNVRVTDTGRLRVRPGFTTALVLPMAGPLGVHSLGRLYQPSTGIYVNFVGIANVLWRGVSNAAMEPISTVASGDPLTMLTYRPAVNGDPWMLVSDRVATGQAPPSGEILLLGLPAPAQPVVTRILDILRTNICSFDNSQGTEAAQWTKTAGPDDSETPITAGVPIATDVPGVQGFCTAFTTNPGAAAKGYFSTYGIARVLDLTQLQGGFTTASQEDIIHLWMRLNRPGHVEEIRVYFVCSSGFSPSVIPGQNDSLNTDAFVKSFTPADITGFLEGQESADAAAAATQASQVVIDYLDNVGDSSGVDSDRHDNLRGASSGFIVNPEQFGTDITLNVVVPGNFSPGRNTWTEFGTVGRPLRRNDFQRIGNTQGRDWSTITGIVIVVKTRTNFAVTLSCDDWYLTGGYDLDSSEPGAASYDYRYTHTHLDTGDEGNPTAVQAEAARLIPVRQRIGVQPAGPYTGGGNARVRQRFYRRGGTITDNWYYIGQNTANGAQFVDTLSDLSLQAAPTLEIDNYEPVPSIDSQGNTILRQPLPVVFGPLDGAIYGLGDARRPGFLYRSKTGKAGSWPPDLAVEVCSPSEELMHGMLFGGQGYVFSRRRLFSIAVNGTTGIPIVQDTACQKGLAGRWAWDLAPQGIAFIADDGVYLTSGGAAQCLSADLAPLWKGRSSGTFVAIDLAFEAGLRVTVAKDTAFVFYRGVDGLYHTLVLDLARGVWSQDVTTPRMRCAFSDRENPELPAYFGSAVAPVVYAHEGQHDNTVGIVASYASPPLAVGRPRELKQLGDLLVVGSYLPSSGVYAELLLDGTPQGAIVLAGNGLASQQLLHDPIPDGTDHRFRTAQLYLSLTQPVTATQPLEIAQILLTSSPLAEETFKRIGQWEPLGATGGYLTGVAITCDTSDNAIPGRGIEDGGSRSIRIEYTRGQTSGVVGTFYVNSLGGRKTIYLSWPGIAADQVRLVPVNDNPWLLYALHWDVKPEPGTVGTWDSGKEVLGDTYYTGCDVAVDAAAALLASVYVDGQLIGSYPIAATAGKALVHLTFGPGYGHVYQLILSSPSGTPFTAYGVTWQTVPVPSEQTNWNRNFETAGTLTDKFVKGVLLECDTAGQTKLVRVQVDSTQVGQSTDGTALSVTANGRQVVHLSFPQVRGRVLRLLPNDAIPSRLWSVQWIFDEEPLGLARWETQLTDHGQSSWHSLFKLDVAYAAPANVLFTLRGFRADGAQIFEDTYPLLSTGGLKAKILVPLIARRAVHWKYLFTCAQPFWLYREGSRVQILPWGGGAPTDVPAPFGNDDLDHNRAMGNASLTAATPNNGQRA